MNKWDDEQDERTYMRHSQVPQDLYDTGVERKRVDVGHFMTARVHTATVATGCARSIARAPAFPTTRHLPCAATLPCIGIFPTSDVTAGTSTRVWRGHELTLTLVSLDRAEPAEWACKPALGCPNG